MAAINVTVPNLGDSVAEATLIKWHRQDGELVQRDQPLCELETDKANADINAPETGVVKRAVAEGTVVKIGQLIATVDPAGKASAAPAAPKTEAKAETKPATAATGQTKDTSLQQPAQSPSATAATALAPNPNLQNAPAAARGADANGEFSPAVRRLIEEHHLDASKIPATGPGGRLTKEDVVNYIEAHDGKAADVDTVAAAQVVRQQQGSMAAPAAQAAPSATATAGDGVRRMPMSKIRKRIAENLVRAQQTAAILTTFNEVDLSAVMEMRKKYKEPFEKSNGVGLGFMSFFVRATCLALKEFPRVNGQIEGDDVVLFDYVNMGIAVSTERGLAVPVLKNADKMGFAKIESEIKRLATAVRDGKLGIQELSGGTFTITNGGIFGSLLSTPIINPPQSGILGMHKIQERPVAVNGQVVIRPMMYVALSYDHRLVDGRESVSFLVKVKEYLEDPARMLIEI
jgi:2-oxoglutarate dehydrogenase E2 component (dihydrolipoamide succinyltransferase)